MINVKLTLIAGVALLLLSGCGNSGGSSTQAAPSESKTSSEKSVDKLPSLKPGLWRTKMIEGEDVGEEPEEECIGPDTDVLADLGVEDTAQCLRRDIRQVADGYTFDVACNSEYVNATLKGKLTGDFADKVDGDLMLGLAPPGQPIVAQRFRYESRRVGSCTPAE